MTTDGPWELTCGEDSELYPTYEAARAAQLDLNRLGLIGSSIDRPDH